MADDQSRGRERDVERVLLIVIDGVDAVIAGHAAGEHSFEVAEHAGERGESLPGPDFGKQLFDRRTYVGSRAHEHCVGHVVVAAAGFSGHVCPCVRALTRWASLGRGWVKDQRTAPSLGVERDGRHGRCTSAIAAEAADYCKAPALLGADQVETRDDRRVIRRAFAAARFDVDAAAHAGAAAVPVCARMRSMRSPWLRRNAACAVVPPAEGAFGLLEMPERIHAARAPAMRCERRAFLGAHVHATDPRSRIVHVAVFRRDVEVANTTSAGCGCGLARRASAVSASSHRSL